MPAYVAAAVAVYGAVQGQKNAKTQAKQIDQAGERSSALAAQARQDALTLYGPAFQRMFDATQTAKDELISGRQRTFDVLQQATGNAQQFLTQGAQAAQSALLGQPSQAFNDSTMFQGDIQQGVGLGGAFNAGNNAQNIVNFQQGIGGQTVGGNLIDPAFSQTDQQITPEQLGEQVPVGAGEADTEKSKQPPLKGPIRPPETDIHPPKAGRGAGNFEGSLMNRPLPGPTTGGIRPAAGVPTLSAADLGTNAGQFQQFDRSQIVNQPVFAGGDPRLGNRPMDQLHGAGAITQQTRIPSRNMDGTAPQLGGIRTTAGTPINTDFDLVRPDVSIPGGGQTIGGNLTGQFDMGPFQGNNVPVAGIIDNPQQLIATLIQQNNQQQASNLQGFDLGQQPNPFANQQTPSNIGLGGAETALGMGLAGATNAIGGGIAGAANTVGQGVMGSEQAIRDATMKQLQALQGGTGQAIGSLTGFGDIARGDMLAGAMAADDTLGQTRGDVLSSFGGANQQIGRTFDRARNDIANITGQSIGRIDQSQGQALDQIRQGTTAATGRLDPFASTGMTALQREAALSGALGPEAEAAAQQEFTESAGQKFLRERQEKALLQNAKATGLGTRGGNVLTALQEQAAGIAAQQQQQRLENMRSLAGRGQDAAGQQGAFEMQGGLAGNQAIQNFSGQRAGAFGQQAGLTGQMAGQQAGLTGQLAGQQAGQLAGIGGQRAGLQAQTGQNLAGLTQNIGGNVAGLQAGLGGQQAGVFGNQGQFIGANRFNAAQNLAGMQNQAGQNLAGIRAGFGQNLAGIRNEAGQNLAQQNNALAAMLAQQQTNLGSQLAGVEGQTAANLSNLARQLGVDESQLLGSLAALLGNISGGQSSQQLQLGQLQAQATGGQAAAQQNTMGTLAQLIGMFGGGG
ncbi:MAG: hypothetical protein Unbinned6354contig1000_6 [Prokaryotic dsDNA virus sp.]|nr:hypothetical protein [Cytophagaceae bacterium]QDP54303.1 MAG: hypothetical protein Unbinned6354contig1000_6 [Prokaryotic dsDNA virus sp.]|tara:strand:+ start:17701 stop:20424 length:2724 start_codon:yes stop_codon:yes gene_type:complete